MSAPLPSHSRAKDAQSQFLDLVFCNSGETGSTSKHVRRERLASRATARPWTLHLCLSRRFIEQKKGSGREMNKGFRCRPNLTARGSCRTELVRHSWMINHRIRGWAIDQR